jgi:hypothetical protein
VSQSTDGLPLIESIEQLDRESRLGGLLRPIVGRAEASQASVNYDSDAYWAARTDGSNRSP